MLWFPLGAGDAASPWEWKAAQTQPGPLERKVRLSCFLSSPILFFKLKLFGCYLLVIAFIQISPCIPWTLW